MTLGIVRDQVIQTRRVVQPAVARVVDDNRGLEIRDSLLLESGEGVKDRVSCGILVVEQNDLIPAKRAQLRVGEDCVQCPHVPDCGLKRPLGTGGLANAN